jgi:hypothetical protein
MGLLDKSKNDDTPLSHSLAHIVSSATDAQLEKVVKRDQASILECLNPEETVTFLGRAIGSSRDTVPAGSTVFVTTLAVGYARKGEVETGFPTQKISRAVGGFESGSGAYRVSITADQLHTSLIIDFVDEATQHAFITSIGCGPA